MKENDIDDLFKKSFENFEPSVKPSVWKNIQVGLKWGGAGLVVKFILNKIGTNTLVAILSSAATVVSTVAVMNWSNSNEKGTSEANKAKVESLNTAEKKVTTEIIINESVEAVVEEQKKEAAKQETTEKIKVENNVSKDESKPEESVENVIESKQKIKSVISNLSEQSIASISASPVGGSVPLIVNLVNTGSGSTNKWTYSDGKKENNSSNPVHVFENPGMYTVVLTSTNIDGKTATDSIHIEVTGNSSISSIPTLFSPNGDGIADVFTFQSKNMVNMKVEIFDKKGTVYYKWLGNGGKWDGKNPKGEKAKEGTYFYLITAEGVDGKKYEQKGAINLAR